jgi:hypothetical protein
LQPHKKTMDKKKLTQEELNALSPRARKAYEGEEVISEILTENPNKEEPTIFEIDKEEEENEIV